MPDNIISPLYDEYLSAPEKIDSEYAEKIDLYNNMLEAWLSSGRLDEELPIIDNQYIETEYLNDNDVYDKLYYNVYRNNELENLINDIIDRSGEIAQNDLIKNNGYTQIGQKQLFIIEQYKDTLNNTQVGFENTRGWDILLEVSFPCIFALIFVVLTTGFVYSYEHINKTLPIVLTTPNGRINTSISKAIAAAVLSVSVLFVFYIPVIIEISLSIGFSNPLNAIQAFEPYSLCPYRLNVMSAVIIVILLRASVLVLIALSINMITKIFEKYLFSVFFGSAICGISVLIYLLASKLNPTGLVYIINPITILITPVPLIRLYTVSIARTILDSMKIATILITVIIVITFILSLIYKNIFYSNRIIRSPKSLRKGTGTSKIKAHSLFLFKYEFLKAFKIGSVCLILVLFSIDIIGFYQIYSTPHSINDTVTEEYMKTYHGILTDEKIDNIKNEYDALVQVLSNKNEYDRKYLANEISADEYVEYIKDYQRASYHESSLSDIYQIAIQPDAVNKIWLVYESGWNNLFFGMDDIWLIVAIIIIASLVVTKEYEHNASGGAFINILCMTKKGHRPTYRTKTSLVILFALFLLLFTYTIKLLILKSFWSFDDINAPLSSISNFSIGNANISIGFYLFIHMINKCISCVILGLLTMSISILVKHKYAALSISVIILALPEVLNKYIKIDWVKYISIFSFTDIYCSSSNKVFPYLLLISLLILSVSAILITQHKRFLCKLKR